MLAGTKDNASSSINMEAIKEWPVFPETTDRSKLPGFNPHWPKGEDFEALYTAFTKLFPDTISSIDKVSLMAVWLTMRLPYQVDIDLQPPMDSSPDSTS